jgi:hypothetical protein
MVFSGKNLGISAYVAAFVGAAAPAMADAPKDYTPLDLKAAAAQSEASVTIGSFSVAAGCDHLYVSFNLHGWTAGHKGFEFQGISMSARNEANKARVWDSTDHLRVVLSDGYDDNFTEELFLRNPETTATVWHGEGEKAMEMQQRALLLALYMNIADMDYMLLWQNSNSAAKAFLDLLDLEIPDAMEDEICFPGVSALPDWWDEDKIIAALDKSVTDEDLRAKLIYDSRDTLENLVLYNAIEFDAPAPEGREAFSIPQHLREKIEKWSGQIGAAFDKVRDDYELLQRQERAEMYERVHGGPRFQ